MWIAAGGASVAMLTTAVLLGPSMRQSTATSHWDAPATTADKQIDATDLYAFTSPERPDTVTIVAGYIPFQAPHKPYQFDTGARYEVHVDNTGTGKPAITYRWTFADKGLPVPLLPRQTRAHRGRPGRRPDRAELHADQNPRRQVRNPGPGRLRRPHRPGPSRHVRLSGPAAQGRT